MAVSVEPVSQLSPLEFSVCHDEADCILMSENEAVVSKISQYLSGMQTTSNGTAVILGQLTTTELSTVDASEFCPFSNLTTLNAPRINASSSSFLEYLPNLVHVNLSYNELTEINGIPHCSCLETVGLSHNHLERLPDLSALKFLRKLDLNHNQLTSIEGIRGCELLQWLHLGNNRLTASALMGPDTIKQLYGSVDSVRTLHQSSMNSSSPGCSLNIRPPLLSLTSLRVLNLSGNCDLSTAVALQMTEQEGTHLKQLGNSNSPQSTQDHLNVIQDSENYGIFPISVTHLYLSGCRISALSGLTALKRLNVLNLKDNEIVDNYELKTLHGLRLLRNLDVRNNPICEQANYRFRVMHFLDQLKWLDEEEISPEDYVRAREFFQPSMKQLASQDHRINVLYHAVRPQQLRACTLPTLSIPYPILALIGPTGSNKRLLCQRLVRLAGEYFGQVKCYTDRPPRRLAGRTDAGRSCLTVIAETQMEQLDEQYNNPNLDEHDIGLNEEDDSFYHFVDTDTFKHKRESGDFIQTAVIMGYQYGLSWSSLEDVARKGLIGVFTGELEAQLSLKLSCLQPHYILCLPTDEYAHEQRLRSKYESIIAEPKHVAGIDGFSMESEVDVVENRVQWCLRRTSRLYQDAQQETPGVFDGVINTDDIHESFIKLTGFVQEYLGLENHHPLIQRMLNSG